MQTKRSRALGLTALAVFVVGLAGCAGDEDDGPVDSATTVGTPRVGTTATATPKAASSTGDVEDDVRAALAAQQDGDIDEFLSYWTARGLQAEFGVTPEEVRAEGSEAIKTPLEARQFRGTQVTGERATTQVEIGSGEEEDDEFVFARTVELIRQGDKWLIDNTIPAEVQAPANVRSINVELADFAFRFQPSEFARGDALIRLRNTGTQPHELALVRVPDNFNLEEALLSEDEPEGLTFIVGAMAQPGQSSSVLIMKDLEVGRHIMVCFLPDTTDPAKTPHAFKGMVADFRIQ